MKHAVKHIHFVGVGGAGMSGIAEILHNLGYTVSGSDQTDSADDAPRWRELRRARVRSATMPRTSPGAEAVVTSTAVKGDNPEVIAARATRMPVVPRAVMLAELMRLKQGIAIAGTHGKTTTTSLVTSVLAEAGARPDLRHRRPAEQRRRPLAPRRRRLHRGRGRRESTRRSSTCKPMLAVVTNIDADHMDTYGHDFARLKQAFVEFLHRMPFYGAAILCGDDPGVRAIMPMISRPVVTYGLGDDVQVRAVDVQALPAGDALRRAAPQRRCACPIWTSRSTCPACTTCSTRWRRSRWPPNSSCPTRRWSRRWPSSPASAGASSATATMPARGRRAASR